MRSPSSSSPGGPRPSRETVAAGREPADVHANQAAGEDRDLLLRPVHEYDDVGRAHTAAAIGHAEGQHVRGAADGVRDLRDRRRRVVVDPEAQAVGAGLVAGTRLDDHEVPTRPRHQQPAHTLEAAVGLEVGIAVLGKRRLSAEAVLVACQEDLRHDGARRLDAGVPGAGRDDERPQLLAAGIGARQAAAGRPGRPAVELHETGALARVALDPACGGEVARVHLREMGSLDIAPPADVHGVRPGGEHDVAGAVADRGAGRRSKREGQALLAALGQLDRGRPLEALGGDRPGASAVARVAQLDRPLDRLARPQEPEADARRRSEQAGRICGLHIDHAAARGQHARQVLVRGVVEDRPCRQHERGLDLRRRPRGMALVQQRRRAGHGRGRHARARPGAVAAGDRRDDVDAGRRNVRLERQRVRRRPTRGERGDQPGVRGDLLVRLVVERERELTAGDCRLLGEAGADQIGHGQRALLGVGRRDRIACGVLDVDDAEGTRGERLVGAPGRAVRTELHEHERARATAAAIGRDDHGHAGLPSAGDLFGSVGGSAEGSQVGGHGAGAEHAERDSDEAADARGSDRDGIGCRAGRGDRAAAEVVPAVAGSDDGHDTGARCAVDGARHDVVGGLHLGLAEREVEHVHAVRHCAIDGASDLGAVAVETEGGSRRREHAVGAEVGVGRNAGEVGDRHAERGAGDAREAGGDARDVRAVLGAVGVERRAHACASAGRRERARDDDLAVRAGADALREARRVLVGGARERRPRDVDAVVDDADAHAVAGRGDAAVQPAPERGGSHDRGHAVGLDDSVGLGVIRHGRPHAQYAGHAREAAQLVARECHDERVHDGAQAAADLQPRSRAPQAELGSVLIACERRECEAGRHAPEVDMPARVAQLVQRSLLRDRRSAQLNDDFGARRGRVRGRSGEGQQRTERDEQGTRWQPHVFRVPRTGRFSIRAFSYGCVGVGRAHDVAGGGQEGVADGRNPPPRRGSSRSAASPPGSGRSAGS